MIDPQSQKFLKFAEKKLSDEDTYQDLVAHAIYQIDQFFNQPREKVVPRLLEKLERSAKELGDPKKNYTSRYQVTKEHEDEHLDELGYTLLMEYLYGKD